MEEREQPVAACRGVHKTFRTFRRQPGWRGIWRNLVRRERVEIAALIDVDLEVRKGDFVGLIGLNGAGKTTLVKCLTGIIPATSGEATLLCTPSFELGDREKRKLALVTGQRSQLGWDIPALDSFRLLGEIYGVPEDTLTRRVEKFAALLEVADRLTIQVRHLSLGQRMKMEIIGAFVHEPEVVFLDEPTIGLDLVSRETIRRFLRQLNRECGTTIVLTSHDMEDIEETCQRLVVLERGRVAFDGDLIELQRLLVGERTVELHLAPGSDGWSPRLAAELEPFGARFVRAGPLSVVFAVPSASSQPFVKHLFDLFEVRDLTVERMPLEQLIRELLHPTTDAGRALSAGVLRRR